MGARNQGAVERHVDITHLETLDDVVFFALKVQFHLIVKRKRCLGVVIHTELQTVANLTLDIHLNALAEIKGKGLLVTYRNPRIFNILVTSAETNFSHTLWTNFYEIAPEYLAKGFVARLNLGYQTFAVAWIIPRRIVQRSFISHVILFGHVVHVLAVLINRPYLGNRKADVANLFVHQVVARSRVVNDFLGVVRRFWQRNGNTTCSGSVRAFLSVAHHWNKQQSENRSTYIFLPISWHLQQLQSFSY